MNGPYKVVYFAGAEITISISDENMYKTKLDIISTHALGGHTRIVTNNMLLFMFWYYQSIKRTSSFKAFFCCRLSKLLRGRQNCWRICGVPKIFMWIWSTLLIQKSAFSFKTQTDQTLSGRVRIIRWWKAKVNRWSWASNFLLRQSLQ